MIAIGQRAHALLAAGCAGRVMAVVSGAVYLQTDEGEIFWLMRPHTAMHARGIACDWRADDLAAGMAFRARALVLEIGARVQIDARGAALWQPRTVGPAALAPRGTIAARLAALGGDPDRCAMPGQDVAGAFLHPPFADRFAQTDSGNMAAFVERCKLLIGLGPGLTPAGDDFVGGFLFAWRHLGDAGAIAWDQQPVDDLIAWARDRTNAISHVFLRDLADGQGPEPLHDLLCALLERDARESPATCADRLRRVGSSTGAQLLGGALTALRLFIAA
ncbi:MAG: DUF2877 domain-containing protein [Anaerolineae bacterium]